MLCRWGPCSFEVSSLDRREDLANVDAPLGRRKNNLAVERVDFPSFSVTVL